jgi:hypothetical protein
VGGFGETRFDEVLQGLMESRGLGGPADLSGLLRAAGHPVGEERIRAFMEGDEWVDGRFPGWVVEVLDLDPEEIGILANAVAYGQVRSVP